MEREVSELDRKLILKRNYLDKIYYHQTKDPIDQDELYTLVRKFFGEYLKLDYEFTYEELSQELNKVFIKPKVKEQIDNFLIRLSETEYLEELHLGTMEINSYLDELNGIIKEIIYEENAIAEQTTSILKKVLKISDNKQILSEIDSYVDETIFNINKNNVDAAKKSYSEMMKAYESLNKSDKKSVHDKLDDVYGRLQELIKNPNRATSESMYSESKNKPTDKLNNLISESLSYIESGNSDLAKRSYTDLLKIYDSLDKDAKKNYNSKVTELYDKIQTMAVGKKKTDPKQSDQKQPNFIPEAPAPSGFVPPAVTSADIVIPDLPQANQNGDVGLFINDGPANLGLSFPKQPEIVRGSDAEVDKIEDFSDALNKQIESLRAPKQSDTPAASISTASSQKTPAQPSQTPQSSQVEQKSQASNVQIQDAPQSIPSLSSSLSSQSLNNQSLNASLPSAPSGTVSDSSNTLLMPGLTLNFPSPSNVNVALTNNLGTTNDLIKDSDKTNFIDTKTDSNKLFSVGTPSGVSLAESSNKNGLFSTTTTPLPIAAKPNDKKIDVQKTTSKPVSLSDPLDAPKENDDIVTKLMQLLNRTNDDVRIEKFDTAKKSYKEALLIYRSLDDIQKAASYQKFHSTFKKLDEALHQKSLHELVDKHSDMKNVSRKMSEPKIDGAKEEDYVPQSLDVLKLTTLPIIMDNKPETIRVYELIEESYFNISNSNMDLAMLKYFKALDLYKGLSFDDRKKLYSNLHDLFKTLSEGSSKKNVSKV